MMRFFMFKQIYISVLTLLLCFTFSGVSRPVTAQNNLPPIIDREIFFGNPEISGARISPDGKFIAFRKPYKGTMNIWLKRAAEPFDRARVLTNESARPISSFFWSRDSRFILFNKDNGGDENFNVYAVAVDSKPETGAEVPIARNLTNAGKVQTSIYRLPLHEPDAIYVGLNDRDPKWHDLYKIKISTGERTLLRQNTDRFVGWQFDNTDKLRLARRSTTKGDTEILRLDAGDKSTRIYSCSVFEECAPIRFHKDNRRVYMITSKGADTNLSKLVLLDVETGEVETVESDPRRRVDFSGATFSNLTGEIIWTSYEDDKLRFDYKDPKFAADYKFLQNKFAGKIIDFLSGTKDEQLWLTLVYSDIEPGEVYLFDRRSQKLTRQYRTRERLPREHLAEMQTIRYKSSDGLEIPAYLTLPKGVPAKNLPLIVNPHGGPQSRNGWSYNSYAQFWANRGYAVLQPNFRGSTGYGKQFVDAGNLQWGEKMQDDLTWGAKHLIAQGIVDEKRVGIIGGSYGGYAALAGVAFTPDFYRAAVAIVAPSNLITTLEIIPPYWESLRIIDQVRVGDLSTAAGRAQLERQSPLNFVERIKTPLMIVHGANDPRVNKIEGDQIVVAMRDKNLPVEYIVAPDEGHGFQRPVNSMAMLAAAERFFAKHLGGRYQESMTPEVAKRLKEITVDVNTVSVPKKGAK
ncbi:MAG TPA: S9 family peptidase [Pyrinomonadaceae bacterium]|jgi:dipeptidyl aminopeptidase/acylaminoacyl peptidase